MSIIKNTALFVGGTLLSAEVLIKHTSLGSVRMSVVKAIPGRVVSAIGDMKTTALPRIYSSIATVSQQIPKEWVASEGARNYIAMGATCMVVSGLLLTVAYIAFRCTCGKKRFPGKGHRLQAPVVQNQPRPANVFNDFLKESVLPHHPKPGQVPSERFKTNLGILANIYYQKNDITNEELDRVRLIALTNYRHK